MKRHLLGIVVLLIASAYANAQRDYKWEREHPGVREKPKGNTAPGFAANRVFEILNQIPIIHQPKGFDVRQSSSIRLNGNVYKGLLTVGLPRYYRWGNGPLLKEGEYYMTHIYINDREEMRDIYSHFMSEETDKLKLPTIYTDTFAVSYQTINGCLVGTARSRVNQNLYVLNPRMRPLFIPVTKEEFVKLWVGKLGLDIAKEKEQLAIFKEQINDIKDNAEALANMKQTIKLSEVWLDYLLEKKKVYDQKLASLTEGEKKEPAYYATPKKMAVLQEKGKYVDKVTGDMANEMPDLIEAQSKAPLFRFNPDFFDPKLPKTAFQLIVIKDGFRQGWKESELMPLIEKEFFPLINFKQLTELMYK